MNADLSALSVLSVFAALFVPFLVLMLLSVPGALLDPAKALLWGIQCLFAPKNR